MPVSRASLLLLPAFAVLIGCSQPVEGAAEASEAEAFAPHYHGIRTAMLDGDLVNFHVAMSRARDGTDVEDYARCAAAQYALIRGHGFARHLRTTLERSGQKWTGDAIYTISAALPRGIATIDAEVTVRDCAARAVPTI